MPKAVGRKHNEAASCEFYGISCLNILIVLIAMHINDGWCWIFCSDPRRTIEFRSDRFARRPNNPDEPDVDLAEVPLKIMSHYSRECDDDQDDEQPVPILSNFVFHRILLLMKLGE